MTAETQAFDEAVKWWHVHIRHVHCLAADHLGLGHQRYFPPIRYDNIARAEEHILRAIVR